MIGGVLLVARPPGLFDTRVDDFDVLGKKNTLANIKKLNFGSFPKNRLT
jgi:hypothetical protein